MGGGAGDGEERGGVEVVGVEVAGGGEVDHVEEVRGDDAFAEAHVRFGGGGVFFSEGVGEVGVEEEIVALPLEEKAALAEPPDAEGVRAVIGGEDFRAEGCVFEDCGGEGGHGRVVRMTAGAVRRDG